MASMFGPLPGATRGAPKDRWGLLVKAIIEVFCAHWTPGAAILGVRDSRRNNVHLNSKALAALGVTLDSAAKIPDVIVHHRARNWLLLIEAVTSAGLVDGKRRKELKALFTGCKAGLVFVTAFENRRTMQRFISHRSAAFMPLQQGSLFGGPLRVVGQPLKRAQARAPFASQPVSSASFQP